MLRAILFNIFSLIADVFAHYRKKLSKRLRPVSHLRSSLKIAQNYAQYEDIAERLDYEMGNDVWRRNPQSRKYDHRVIADRIVKLRHAREHEDVVALVDLLRSGLLRNLANIGDKQLYNRSYLGTKILIQDYTTEVMQCLEYVRSLNDSSTTFLTAEKKLQFFKDTKHSYGLTALILQGGASFGMFHLGVLRALWEQALLPTVISGTAVGALIAALACIATDEELPPLLYEGMINIDAFNRRGASGQTLRKIKRLFTEGYLLDISVLGEVCRDNLGDITFEEAFLRTHRILNITIHSTSANSVPSLLNYLTAPNVLIWTAALASNALPGLYEPVELLCKDQAGDIVPWAPYGGLKFKRTSEAETPLDRLSELFNVNNFIVSQARPYLAPFISSPLHRHRRRGWYLKCINVIGLEISHRLGQLSLMGLLPVATSPHINNFVSQQSEIVLVPELAVRDYLTLFRHPTHKEISYWVQKGERATWPAISLLRIRTLIEVTLRECFEELRHEEQLFSSSREATPHSSLHGHRHQDSRSRSGPPGKGSRKRSRTTDQPDILNTLRQG